MNHFFRICTIMELKELNWFCKHVRNVKSSQPYISMNFCTEFSKHKFFHVSIVKLLFVAHEPHDIPWKLFLKRHFIADILLQCLITVRTLECLGELSKLFDHRYSLTEAAMEKRSLKIVLHLIAYKSCYLLKFF